MKSILKTSLVGLATISFINTLALNYQLLPSDFQALVRTWEGSLTYLDYSSGKLFTMPTNVTIAQIPNTPNYIFSNLYPNEPKANSSDTVVVSRDGKMIDKEILISRKNKKPNELEIITEISGKDGNEDKVAKIRHIYLLSENSFSTQKEVKFEGSEVGIKRHEYRYQKK